MTCTHISFYAVKMQDIHFREENFSSLSLVQQSLDISFARDPKGPVRLIDVGKGTRWEIRQGMVAEGPYYERNWTGGEVVGEISYHHYYIRDQIHPL